MTRRPNRPDAVGRPQKSIDKPPPRKQASGGARMMATGKKPLLLFLTVEQHALIKRVADHLNEPMTRFVINQALYYGRQLDAKYCKPDRAAARAAKGGAS